MPANEHIIIARWGVFREYIVYKRAKAAFDAIARNGLAEFFRGGEANADIG